MVMQTLLPYNYGIFCIQYVRIRMIMGIVQGCYFHNFEYLISHHIFTKWISCGFKQMFFSICVSITNGYTQLPIRNLWNYNEVSLNYLNHLASNVQFYMVGDGQLLSILNQKLQQMTLK